MKNEYMIITYCNTLYKQTSSYRTCGQITFSNDGIHFSSGGHRHALKYENVLRIEPFEN